MDGLQLDYDRYLCPSTDTDRGPLGYVNPCIDVPGDCRVGDRFEGCSETAAPGTPACNGLVGYRRLGCEDRIEEDGHDVTAPRAREKLFRACALYGSVEGPTPDWPQPRRFCFTSCVEPYASDPSREGQLTCDADLFDPPEVTHASAMWEITPDAGSTAQIEVDGERVTVALHGEVAVDAPACGPMMTCEVILPWIRLEADDFSVRGRTVHGGRVLNPTPFAGSTIAADSTTRSTFEIPAGAPLYVTGEISGSGPAGGAYTARSPMRGHFQWDTRELVLNGRFEAPDGSSSLELELRGAIPNLPPVADAGSDQTVECTSPTSTEVTLSAGGSRDPDLGGGQQDIRAYAWFAAEPNVTLPQGTGASFSPRLSPGRHRYQLSVRDSRAAMGQDNVTVEVVDTTAPHVEAEGGCLAPDESLRLVRLDDLAVNATDLCSEAPPATRIVGARSDDPRTEPGDVRVADDRVCLRATPGRLAPRQYTLTLETTDSAGNATETEIEVSVPYPTDPRTGASDCATPLASTETAPDDCPAPVDSVTTPSPDGCDACGCRVGSDDRGTLPLSLFAAALGLVRSRRGSRRRHRRLHKTKPTV
ncbi:MAG: hypothetical protein KC619_21585 [Myxococcales bacterium]|nr:hypothetical protein [Myxococcales bacterium]